jgi:hypothetical protein
MFRHGTPVSTTGTRVSAGTVERSGPLFTTISLANGSHRTVRTAEIVPQRRTR